MRVLKTCFPLFLTAFIVSGFVLFPFSTTQAIPGVKFVGCTAGGVLATQFQEQIEKGAKELGKKIGLGFLLGDTGVLDDKVPVIDEKFISTWTRKEARADIIARCGAREIFNAMSKGIVDNARTAGREGGPVFVRNWRNFQTDAQYRGEGIFRAMMSNTTLCDYIANDLKSLFGATNKTSLPKNTRAGNFDPYALRANCTMPSNFSMTNYKNDFAGNGGWDAWSRMLEPQNNYYGALFGALDEAGKQRALEESADLNQVIANKGLTGKSGNSANDSCQTRDPNGKCLEYKDIQTPGSIIGDSVAATFQQELAWITNVDELNEVISAATEVLLKRLFDFSDPNEGDYTIYEPPTISESPEAEQFHSDCVLNYPPEVGTSCKVVPGPGSNFCSVDADCNGNVPFGTITVNFEITNNSGGSATINDFQLLISGEPTAIGLYRVLPVGEYIIYTGAPTGYALVGITGSCGGDGSFTMTGGQNLACTVTYDDI